MEDLHKFINDQLSVWPMAARNFRALKRVRTREMVIDGQTVILQHNPGRIISSTADTRAEVIAARPCFLCPEHRPAEQFHVKFEGRKGRLYNVQVNPYPIFPAHLVIARDTHIPQAIWHHLPDMLDFTRTYQDYTVFYNGPMSGASAPDHLHFQGCPRHLLPLEESIDAFLDNPGTPLATVKDATLYHYPHFNRGVFALKATTPKSQAKLFYRLLECVGTPGGETEPRFNLYTYFKDGEYRTFVILRSEIRSHHYYTMGADHLTISPGAADMAGMFIAPMAEDFKKATPEMLSEMLAEVSVSKEQEEHILWRITRKQPPVEVGIMSAESIEFEIISDGAGRQKVSFKDGKIDYNGVLYDELYFDSITRSTLFAEPSFILFGVTIGIDFHWEQKRDFRYAGSLKFIVENGKITAINRLGMEDYLLSVISSEMKSTAGLELLKAHAVISRSWLTARIRERRERGAGPHSGFDVCADDHCQRYQGLTMATGDSVRKAIDETWGQVLCYRGELCDARYSKCCGGRTERFSACWENVDYPYLASVPDNDGGKDFCDCQEDSILAQVLNDYDLQTKDFYRWEVRYTRDAVSDLVRRKSGSDLGTIRNLEPLERGDSGRIVRLRIKGDRGEMTVGKELAIRRVLSESHLKSSAFDVRWEGDTLVLNGRGWGHGVGLCQIGAAVMAAHGYRYDAILAHYYPGSELTELQ